MKLGDFGDGDREKRIRRTAVTAERGGDGREVGHWDNILSLYLPISFLSFAKIQTYRVLEIKN